MSTFLHYSFVVRFDNGINLSVVAPNEGIAKEALEEYLSEHRDEIVFQLFDAAHEADPYILDDEADIITDLKLEDHTDPITGEYFCVVRDKGGQSIDWDLAVDEQGEEAFRLTNPCELEDRRMKEEEVAA